jgi:hypothetical protein
MQAVVVGGFHSAADAAAFAERQGWRPVVQENLAPPHDDVAPKSYGDNFAYTADDPKIVRTK